jgi:class 3 adenylate cyclase
MKRRSGADGEPAKSQRRKTVRPKRRNAPRAERGRSAYAVSLRAKVARLTHERDEALEQLIATSEVLGVISSSPIDVQPVFDFIAKSAARLCKAQFCHVFQFDGKLIHQVALHGYSPEVAKLSRRGYPMAPGRGTAVARSILNGTVEEIPDILSDRDYTHGEIAKDLNYRSIVAVPMLKDGRPIGAIAITQSQPGRFPERQIQLLQTFAAQAVIAIENARLLNELRQRTDQIAKLNEQLEQRVTDQVGEIERMGRLRRFLPPQVADLIVASGTEKQLESHRREITALFCDLRGFTGFSESSDPEDVMALLRDYHAAIGQIIVKYSGTLERFAGDGVMVIFNDPVPVENPALQAVLMALDMRTAIGAMIEKWRLLGHDLGFGIGIAHGFATLGTIGFEGRFDYAAIGTVSNVASRLCDEAKPGQILISPRVRLAVDKAVTVEPVGEFTLKGIRRPMMTYNVLETSPAKPN